MPADRNEKAETRKEEIPATGCAAITSVGNVVWFPLDFQRNALNAFLNHASRGQAFRAFPHGSSPSLARVAPVTTDSPQFQAVLAA